MLLPELQVARETPGSSCWVMTLCLLLMTVLLLHRFVRGEALRRPCERLHCGARRRGQHVAGAALRHQADVPGSAGQHGEGRREVKGHR